MEGKLAIDEKEMNVGVKLQSEEDYCLFIKKFLQFVGENECIINLFDENEKPSKDDYNIIQEYKESLDYFKTLGLEFDKSLKGKVKTDLTDKVVKELIEIGGDSWLEFSISTEKYKIEWNHEGYIVIEPIPKNKESAKKILEISYGILRILED